IQPNHRVLTIEDTRELTLPENLHWVPLTTREPNPEGKGGVSMLDLLVNSLRMRPDRIIVGEIRRQREAEVLFEAMHTGHSVYTTVHANTADETIRRLTSPPIEVPISMLEAVHLNIVMFRNRRIGVRRIMELAEFIPERRGDGKESIKANTLFRWRPTTDNITQYAQSIRFFDELSLHTGLSMDEIKKELKTKKAILEWMVKKNLRSIDDVGRTMAQYYSDSDEIVKLVDKDLKPAKQEKENKRR
ncbi:MAG: CpaF/VirB11 family protein, partial [Candidatus Diapherotrites archaeon]|nr:CpaF/VirB11 family protein [Candidatus Diapherotrites archaeon]